MPEFGDLLSGYQRFRANDYARQRHRFDALAREGQHPPLMVISCCDSRVDPATIFDTAPGQMFSVRNVAALVPPFEQGPGLHGTSAAIEFAVRSLDVKHIVVMGHGRCGGIAAALTGGEIGEPGSSFLGDWVCLADPARERVLATAPTDPQRALELETVKLSLANLRQFPYVTEREEKGRLKLHGCWFAIAEARLEVLDEVTGTFRAA